jgi:hypothetical protein
VRWCWFVGMSDVNSCDFLLGNLAFLIHKCG